LLKQKEKCTICNQIRYMTRHHVKDKRGRKTGEIQKMCRDCHDEIEEEYRLQGMIKPAAKKSKSTNLTSHLNKESQSSSLIPFYARGKK